MITEPGTMDADEIVAVAKRHTLFDWSAQASANPIAVDHAEGVYFWGTDGTRYFDLNSQLMGVNIGHGDRRVVEAMARQPEAAGMVRGTMFIGIGLIEALALIGFVLSFII